MNSYDIDSLMKIVDTASNGLIDDETYQKFKLLFLDLFDQCDLVFLFNNYTLQNKDWLLNFDEFKECILSNY